MQKWKKWILAIPLTGLSFHLLSLFCEAQTDGFSVARIHSDLPYNPAWQTSSSPEILDNALNQTYRYLSCGGQCFAFASDDGKYVMKFFKHRIRKPYSLYLTSRLFPPFENARRRKLSRALFKMNRDFQSYKIAYETLPQETGVIFIHLNKSSDLKRNVQIVDKLGIAHTIALDEVEFVLQKKAELAYAQFDSWIKNKDLALAKKGIHAMLETILSRCKKGIYDEDPRIHRNFGFIDDKPIFIDVGRFVPDANRKDKGVYTQDMKSIIKNFRDWLEETHPPLVEVLDEEMHALQND